MAKPSKYDVRGWNIYVDGKLAAVMDKWRGHVRVTQCGTLNFTVATSADEAGKWIVARLRTKN